MPELTTPDPIYDAPQPLQDAPQASGTTAAQDHAARLDAGKACPRCGVIDTPTQGPGSGPHTASLRCAHCGAWLQWHSTKSRAERQQARVEAMAHQPATQRQLAYLASLGDQARPPGSMWDASQRIATLVRGEGRG